MLQEADAPATIFACARALECNPEIAPIIAANDWDVCVHGDRRVRRQDLGPDEERAAIVRAFAVIPDM